MTAGRTGRSEAMLHAMIITQPWGASVVVGVSAARVAW